MKNLSLLFILFISVSFMGTSLNAQSCKKVATSCVKSTVDGTSTAVAASTTTPTTPKTSCASTKTSCSPTSAVSTIVNKMTAFKAVNQSNNTTEKANYDPSNCEPSNCDPSNCKPAACGVSKNTERKTSTSI